MIIIHEPNPLHSAPTRHTASFLGSHTPDNLQIGKTGRGGELLRIKLSFPLQIAGVLSVHLEK